MLFFFMLAFIASTNLVIVVTAKVESKPIETHGKVISKRSDGLMLELVNLLVDEKFHRKTNKMVKRMLQQNKRILEKFASFERNILTETTKMKKIASEMKTLKKEFGMANMEQEKTKELVTQIQKKIGYFNSTNVMHEMNKTALLLLKQMETLKTSVRVGKKEQEKTRKKINKIQKNIGDFNRTTFVEEINKTTSMLSKQIESQVNTINDKITKLKNSVNVENGAVYIRWGRTKCPSPDTKLVYSGFAAGGFYSAQAGTDTQCLPKNPDWRKYHDASNTAARIYGAEYEVYTYSVGEALHKNYHNYDVPCAVCQSQKRLNVHMIPAKDRCDNGWHLEYRGYLMTEHYNHGASNYACMDARPEKIGSKANQNGRLFYPVESICGSLPCPPYVNYRELTCAVCTF